MEKLPSASNPGEVTYMDARDTTPTYPVTAPTPWYKKVAAFLFQSWTFGKFLESTQAVADDEVVGKIGIVHAAVTPTQMGEVSIPIRGGTETFLAVSNKDYMPVNSSVYVEAIRSNRTVIVSPYGATVEAKPVVT